MGSPLEVHPAGRSSLSSLPHDQLDEGYNPYTARVRGMDPAAVDPRSSPHLQAVPNRAGSTTPTRSNIYHLQTTPTPQSLKSKPLTGHPTGGNAAASIPPLRHMPGPWSTFYPNQRYITHSKRTRYFPSLCFFCVSMDTKHELNSHVSHFTKCMTSS